MTIRLTVAEAALLPICVCLLSRRRSLRVLRRWMALALAAVAALWLPLYLKDGVPACRADSAQMEQLCHRLIAELNDDPLTFTGGRAALSAAGLPRSAKYAMFPAWMRWIHAAGVYIPWTGEALVSPELSDAAIPFVACHELTHARGIADEGRANVEAYFACQRAGGQAAASAKLWALRYAMSALYRADPAAWTACSSEMNPRLFSVFDGMRGFMILKPSADYDILAHILAKTDSF